MAPDHHTCLFCKITVSEVPSHTVHESERIVAFLNINPIRPGHTQIVPRQS
jgi:histidine triad (HIT) family protein